MLKTNNFEMSYKRLLVKPSLLSFITTFKCTAACDNCCFRCSPTRTETIPLSSIKRIIDEATLVSEIRVIVFTGGECFIEREKLIEAIKYAKKYDYITRCVSNGYWAKDITTAQKIVSEAKEAGLVEINFSAGDNHQKYIPLQNVINAVIASCEADLTTVVNIELFNASQLKQTARKIFRHIKEKYPKLIINYGLWINRGDKVTMEYDSKYHLLYDNHVRKGACTSINASISVTPDEKLLACCGLLAEDIPEMELGDLKTESMINILNKQEEDILKTWIFLEGPQAVLEQAKSFNQDISLQGSPVHHCQLCKKLYNEIKNREAVVKACTKMAPYIYDRILSIDEFNQCFSAKNK